VARRAKADAARRRAHERRVAVPEPIGDGDRPEPWPELHEEIARLPEKYQAAVVLCYLEGLTTEAAARKLGCPQGTVLSRLSRAREQLRGRLTRRGLAVPTGLLVTGLSPNAARATVPAMLFDSVIQAAMRIAANKTTAGVVSASVATLIEGVMKAMFVTRLKTIALGLMALGVVAVGVGSLSPASPQRPEEDRAQTPSGAANEPEQGKRADPGRPLPKQVPVKPGSLVRIEVLEALPGRPLSGLRPVRPDGTISLDYYGDLYVAGMTREEIKAKLVEHLRKQLPDEILLLSGDV
jgi:predicted DNA-binding protein (UPF0251 family)